MMTQAATNRAEHIRQALHDALATDRIEVLDDSHLHVGHAGARDGKGHFRVKIVSDRFKGLRTIARHQLVYQSLGPLMRSDIHALGIVALTPDEAL
jgi:BolA protein